MIFMKYDFAAVEKKWQDIWETENTFAASNDYTKPKFYALVEFPYPSGQGLHVGHPRSYTALDIVARKRRMQGYNVLYPMGWDAFGLPTENFAIKNHIHPEIVTQEQCGALQEPAQEPGPLLRLDPGDQHHRSRATTSGPSGSSCSSSSTAWPIKRRCRSTGAPPASACWPTRKWSAASASAAAARWSTRSRASGC